MYDDTIKWRVAACEIRKSHVASSHLQSPSYTSENVRNNIHNSSLCKQGTSLDIVDIYLHMYVAD
jgi:hypothetical protein